MVLFMEKVLQKAYNNDCIEALDSHRQGLKEKSSQLVIRL